jgi:hypothetical protein
VSKITPRNAARPRANCGVGPTLHHCTRPSISNIRFYDISGANATDPELLHQFDVNTHEFSLWEDPSNPERALMFAGNAGSTCGTSGGAPSCPFSVWDISPVRDWEEPETLFSGLHGYTRFPPAPALSRSRREACTRCPSATTAPGRTTRC